MPQHPADRFDELPADAHRVGAHRAEQPRVSRGRILLWATVATVAIVTVGIFGTLLAGGRLGGGPGVTAGPTSAPTADAVVDTSYLVLVLNATPQETLGDEVAEQVVGAGWSAGDVTSSDAGSHDFERTTVFYSQTDDEGPARGLAEAIGGADVEFSEAYQESGDGALRQLVVVVGLDRAE